MLFEGWGTTDVTLLCPAWASKQEPIFWIRHVASSPQVLLVIAKDWLIPRLINRQHSVSQATSVVGKELVQDFDSLLVLSRPRVMDKTYQIVVLGATGFVGKLVMLHIAETPQYAVRAPPRTEAPRCGS